MAQHYLNGDECAHDALVLGLLTVAPPRGLDLDRSSSPLEERRVSERNTSDKLSAVRLVLNLK